MKSKLRGPDLLALGRLPYHRGTIAWSDVPVLHPTGWGRRLARLGIVDVQKDGAIRIRDEDLVKACRLAVSRGVDAQKLLGRYAHSLGFLAALPRSLMPHLEEVACAGTYEHMSELLPFLVNQGVITCASGRRRNQRQFEWGPGTKELQNLVLAYRGFLARRGPPGSKCIHQRGGEVAWQIRRQSKADYIAGHDVALGNATPKTSILFQGMREPDDLDWMLLGARAALRLEWNNPAGQVPDDVIQLVAKRIDATAFSYPAFQARFQFYGFHQMLGEVEQAVFKRVSAGEAAVNPLSWTSGRQTFVGRRALARCVRFGLRKRQARQARELAME
jgi:hypothetical protein